jgi:hypothetical protein
MTTWIAGRPVLPGRRWRRHRPWPRLRARRARLQHHRCAPRLANGRLCPQQPRADRRRLRRPAAQIRELTVLTGSAEAVAEALAHGPDRIAAVLAGAHSDAPWRTAMGLAQPAARLGKAIDSLRRFVLANVTSDEQPTYDAILAAAGRDSQDEEQLDGMVRRLLLSMLEERKTRRPARPQLSRDDAPQFSHSNRHPRRPKELSSGGRGAGPVEWPW